MLQAKIMPYLSMSAHTPSNTCKMTHFMLWYDTSNQIGDKRPRTDKETEPGCILAQFSLRLKGLAQARGFSCSVELLSPRRELEKGNNDDVAFFRLGETSSPKRDGLSLKTGARSLSDSSHNTWVGFLILSLRRDPLAWAKLSDFRNCSRKPTQKLSRARHNTCSY